ncbi:hypothetical protein CN645_30170 [Burkholderia sp. IDO3]|nr:hypothetical protein DCN14_01950 [Burkholderia sp. IDO3]PCD58156.1 hypothetical protein CN645_30170 [Burkholderia sp. IDO3]
MRIRLNGFRVRSEVGHLGDERVDLLVLSLEVLILLLQMSLHLLITFIDPLLQFRKASIARSQALLDARTRRCGIGHLSPGNEKTARRRLSALLAGVWYLQSVTDASRDYRINLSELRSRERSGIKRCHAHHAFST